MSEKKLKLAESALEELWFGDDDPFRSRQDASESMAAAAAKANDLRPFPAVASRVMALLADPEVEMKAVRTLIETDSGLAARLMRIANSALYGGVMKAETIDQAVFRLGAREVQDVVAGIATLGMFKDVKGIGARFRDHCAGVAGVARVLANEWHNNKKLQNVFLCGLMHDIGKLLSLQVGEIAYDEMDKATLGQPDTVHEQERKLSGYDHAVLGAHVMQLWRLPLDISQVVAWHHQPGRAYAEGGDIGLKVAMLRLADAVELRIAQSAELDEAFVEAIAHRGECAYLDISPEVLAAMWPKLVAARSEMLG